MALDSTELTQSPWIWPFRLSDITAGLRRLMDDASLKVVRLRPASLPYRRPAVGRLSGVMVDYQGKSGPGSCRLVVKEPHGTTRAGLAGAGRREVGVYQSLASQLPLRTPALIAASPSGNWLLLEELEVYTDAAHWSAEDYWRAVDGLAGLHDRFWGLGDDLEAHPWLAHPLQADFEVHIAAATKAVVSIVRFGETKPLTGAPDRLRVLVRLMAQAEAVVEPLRRQPSTLLHGDYWPGNIAVLQGGAQVVYDWQLAAVGPGIIDLLVFVTKSEWWFSDMPVTHEQLVKRYRQAMLEQTGVQWDEPTWNELWDHALMWHFLEEWLDLLAATPESLLQAQTGQLDRIWLLPVIEAVGRHLGHA